MSSPVRPERKLELRPEDLEGVRQRTLELRPEDLEGVRERTLELRPEDLERIRERTLAAPADATRTRANLDPRPRGDTQPQRSIGRQPARSLLEAGVRLLPRGEDIIEGFEGLRPGRGDNLLGVLGAPFGMSGLEPSDVGGGALAKPGFIAGKKLRDVSLSLLRDRRNAELARLRTKFPAQTRQVEGMLENRLAGGRLGPRQRPGPRSGDNPFDDFLDLEEELQQRIASTSQGVKMEGLARDVRTTALEGANPRPRKAFSEPGIDPRFTGGRDLDRLGALEDAAAARDAAMSVGIRPPASMGLERRGRLALEINLKPPSRGRGVSGRTADAPHGERVGGQSIIRRMIDRLRGR